MVHVLAGGVFFSGFVKDLICLPRPVSPPLQRISRSASAALEYGFPSTHSTNAVSVAVFAVWAMYNSEDPSVQSAAPYLQFVFLFYACSIVFGRIYCGMHGYFDVVIGALLGAILAVIQCVYGAHFDTWILTGPFQNTVIATLIALVLVRIHPEPADDCPCFDDSVAFAGVFIGIQLGGWRFAKNPISWNDPIPAQVPFSLAELGYAKATLRILTGVFTVFAWRGLAKPFLLLVLPPIFRVIGNIGLLLPRKYFLSASQYTQVPTLRKDDNVIPPASEIPGMIKSLRHPRRRAVSVGPQSEADAYEAIAFRAHRRRESQSSDTAVSPMVTPALDTAKISESPLGNGHATQPGVVTFESDEKNDEEMFRRLMKPRVRYDVEVVTKLIVYTGIAWIAAEGAPVIFDVIGLGLR